MTANDPRICGAVSPFGAKTCQKLKGHEEIDNVHYANAGQDKPMSQRWSLYWNDHD